MGKFPADELIIQNAGTFEEACQLVAKRIQPKLVDAAERAIEKWVQSQEWRGIFDWWDSKKGVRFYPPDWAVATQAEGIACYEWYVAADGKEPENEYSLTAILGGGRDANGFVFLFAASDAGAKKADFRKFVSDFVANPANKHIDVESAGFHYNEKEASWYLPWRLVPDQVAAQYDQIAAGVEVLGEAFEPLSQALQAIGSAHPFFVRLVAQARRQFKAPGEKKTPASKKKSEK